MHQKKETDTIPPPPRIDSIEQGGGSGRRETVTLICYGCGDVTVATKTIFTINLVLENGPPPVCSRCGIILGAVQK